MLQVTSRADTAVVNVFDTGILTLPENFRSEIDFIVGRANARTQLDDEIDGIRAEMLSHFLDRLGNDFKRGSFFA